MGRSVSYPAGALVAFSHVDLDDDADGFEFDWLLDDATSQVIEMFPSFWGVDEWRGREDHVLARNRLVDFGVSEYCGIVAYWLVPRRDLDTAGLEAFAEQWIATVGRKFLRRFGNLERIGVASNGEAFYRRKVAA